MLTRHFTLGDFHDNTTFSFIKAYVFYFRVGVIFAKKAKISTFIVVWPKILFGTNLAV